MAWHQVGDKPISKPVMAKFYDAIWSPGRNELKKY